MELGVLHIWNNKSKAGNVATCNQLLLIISKAPNILRYFTWVLNILSYKATPKTYT